MPWADRRRLVISIIVGVIAVSFLSVVFIATLYKAPSCTDNAQNQGEAGIDCGGPCPYLCTDQTLAPTVLFTKAVPSTGGRIDVAASIENKNPDAAAKSVSYRVQLYGTDRLPVADISGTVDLPPGATVPIYIPNASNGRQTVANAFLTIDPSAIRWYAISKDPRIVPSVSNISENDAGGTPRITATLGNGSVLPLSNVQVVVFVRDIAENIIAASETIVPVVPPQSSATATFTWNSAFATSSAQIQVMPVIPLP